MTRANQIKLIFSRSIFSLAAVTLCGGVLSVAPPLGAQEVYKWVGDDGRVHFSTTPRPGAEKPSPLPQVRRENIDQRIKSIKEQIPANCEKHGGIDCKQGADTDGSVICLDGFRDAVMPFQFKCLESRLKIEHITHLNKQGEKISEKSSETPAQIQLTLRNLSDVTAQGVKVTFSPFGQKEESRAVGPEMVEPYAIAEYTADFHAPSRLTSPKRKSEYRAMCTNCSGVATGKR